MKLLLKRLFTALFVICLMVLAGGLPVIAAHAASGLPQETAPVSPPVDFDNLVYSLTSLAGVAAMITLLVNAGKTFGVVKDGQASAWSAGLNLLALIGLFAAQTTGYANLIPVVDQQAGSLAVALTQVLAYLFQLYVSRQAHDKVLAGLPVVGKSLSGRKAGESLTVIDQEYNYPPAG